jgi:predicted dehydrogenase
VYEQRGRDYPIGYVRWTETRNMEAFVQLLAEEKLELKPLITHRFPIDRAPSAYELITGKTGEAFLGVLITYPDDARETQRLELVSQQNRPTRSGEKTLSVGLLGAGSFAMATLLPAMKQVRDVSLVGVCAANGSHSRHAAEKFGFRYCSTDDEQILNDSNVNTIVIATRHHLHAAQVLASLRAGKHVFCEKPLCLSEDELMEIAEVYGAPSPSKPVLMVGFNRRFAPLALRMKSFLSESSESLAMHYRVNAGYIAPDHWVNDPEQGGGRLLGEACHFVDFLSFLAGSVPVEVTTRCLANSGRYSDDNGIISLQYANGSQGTISYLANGDKVFSKERIEVFGGSGVAVLEDFRTLELVRHGKKQTVRSRLQQDKGHRGEWSAFGHAIQSGGESPIPFDDIVTSTLATLNAVASRASGQAVAIDSSNLIAARSSR